MPDKRRHRGAHPDDARLFAPAMMARLRAAVADFAWLLERGYTQNAGLKLVGDRYTLTERQRNAVLRCACSATSQNGRRQRELVPAAPEFLRGAPLFIDGYNVLTTVEAALAGGIIIVGQDGCYRDIASMHSTFRTVDETLPALNLIGTHLVHIRAGACTWLLDSPVSNSGRLRQTMLELAAAHAWSWEVNLEHNPDAVLARTEGLITTADGVILDACHQWYNLARDVITRYVPQPHVVDLYG